MANFKTTAKGVVAFVFLLGLASCASIKSTITAQTNTALVERSVLFPNALRLLWSQEVGAMSPFLRPDWTGQHFCTVSSDGTVYKITKHGSVVAAPVALPTDGAVYLAGVGCDDNYMAAVRDNGDLIVSDFHGEIQWQQSLYQSVKQSPIIYNGQLFVLTAQGQLVVYTLKKGSELWRYNLPLKNDIRIGISSLPVVKNNAVYVGINGGKVVAMNKFSGKLLWKKAIGQTAESAFSQTVNEANTPAVDDEIICVASYDNAIACMQTKDGSVLWQADVRSKVNVQLDEYGSRLFVSDVDGVVHAFDAETGKLKWQTDTKAQDLSSPIFVKGAVIVADKQGGISALSAKNGSFIDHFNSGVEGIIDLYAIADNDAPLADIYGLSLSGTLFYAKLIF